MSTIAVCVCTYRRPIGLARLLGALATTQDLDDLCVDGERADVSVVVVDNDAAGSGREAVAAFAAQVSSPVHYTVQPRRGIAQARNTAVSTAPPEADRLVFIDDDETPEPGWLGELASMHRRAGADVVTGPVFADFEATPARWILAGGFFDRPRYADGEDLHYATTSNVLVSRSALAVADPPFNERLGLAGGEDTYFFRQVHLAGHRIVWADRACVREYIPVTRCTARWLLRREYRRGNTLSLCLVWLESSRWRRAKRSARAVTELAHGVLMLLGTPVFGRRALIGGAQRACFAAGLVTGMTGRVYLEYARVHGS